VARLKWRFTLNIAPAIKGIMPQKCSNLLPLFT
jgi:hypothetical protein